MKIKFIRKEGYIDYKILLLFIILFTCPHSSLAQQSPQMELIVVNTEALLERHQMYNFTSDAGVKKLLDKQGIIPTTIDWMEVSLLCEKLYTHLINQKYKCIYEYSKIKNNFNDVNQWCKHVYSDYYVGNRETLEYNDHTSCMQRYGFEEPDSWRSFKKIESIEIEGDSN